MRVEVVVRMRGRPTVILVSSCMLAIAGCASSGPGDVPPDSLSGAAPEATSLEVLTGDEIRETGAGNVWEALRMLRPNWLRARAGATSVVSPQGTPPVVYVAGIFYGPLRTLTTMNVDHVRRVEFINARDATTRFGTGHGGGVILVDLDRE